MQTNVPLILKNGNIKLSHNLEPSDQVICDDTFNTVVSVSKSNKKSFIVKPIGGEEFNVPVDGCIAVLPNPPTIVSEGDLFVLNWWKDTGKNTRCFKTLEEVGLKRSQILNRPVLEIPKQRFLEFTEEERQNYYITSRPLRLENEITSHTPLLFPGYLVGLLLSCGKISEGGKIYLSKRVKTSVITRINTIIFDSGIFMWIKKKKRYDLVQKESTFLSGLKSMLLNKQGNFVIHSTMIQQNIKQHKNLLSGIIEGQKTLPEEDGSITFDIKEFINVQILKCICSFYGIALIFNETMCSLDKRYINILPLSNNSFDETKFKYDNRIGTFGEMYITDVNFDVKKGGKETFVDISLSCDNTKLRTIEGKFMSVK